MTSFALLPQDPRYMVDSDGNVYGVHKMITGTAVGGKYRMVTQSVYAHRAIAEAFIPNPENKPDVAHWDGNGLNNEVTNLRWATEKENMADKKRHGTWVQDETNFPCGHDRAINTRPNRNDCAACHRDRERNRRKK